MGEGLANFSVALIWKPPPQETCLMKLLQDDKEPLFHNRFKSVFYALQNNHDVQLVERIVKTTPRG